MANNHHFDFQQQLSWKEQKEAFVSGHEGSSPWEVLLVCASAPTGIAVWMHVVNPLLVVFLSSRSQQTSESTNTTKYTTVSSSQSSLLSTVLKFGLEIVLVWIPLVICQTIWLFPYGVGILSLQVLVLVVFRTSTTTSNSSNSSSNSSSYNYNHERDWLTSYRSSLMLLTICAILAVDFRIFPRRYCKTEIVGYGLMDVGAASFMVSAGMVASKPRHRRRLSSSTSTKRPLPLQQQQQQQQSKHTVRTIKFMALVLLGLLRLVTNKSVDYQEHASEYGVHWNFFFTLSVVTTVGHSIVQTFYGSSSNANPHDNNNYNYNYNKPFIFLILLIVIQAIYQWCLTGPFQFQAYIETASRTQCPRWEEEDEEETITTTRFQFVSSFWNWSCILVMAQNREGIVGCIGYFVLYGLGAFMAHECLWNDRHASDNNDINNDNNQTDKISNHHDHSNQHQQPQDNNATIKTGLSPFYRLVVWTTTFWLLHWILVDVLHIPVSRRSTNSSFVVWIMAHNGLLLLFLHGATRIHPDGIINMSRNEKHRQSTTTEHLLESNLFSRLPPGLQGLNRHGLLLFVIANLVTGIINLSIPTIEASPRSAFAILVTYLAFVGLFGIALDTMWQRINRIWTRLQTSSPIQVDKDKQE